MDWNELVIDYDRMSAETLLLVEQLQDDRATTQQLEELPPLPVPEVPQVQGPGLLYYVDFQGRTFSIRGLPVTDLNESYQSALQGDEKILGDLRIDGPDKLVDIKLFKTPECATAEVLADQLFNRRFPIHEDSYFNVSDPGPGLWSVERGAHEFCLYFKRVFHQELVTHSLGPIVDPLVAARRFSELPQTLTLWPQELEIKIDEKALVLQPRDPSANVQMYLQNLREICCNGKMIFEKSDFKNTTQGRTSYFFFLELAYTRKFWLEIEQELSRLSNEKD